MTTALILDTETTDNDPNNCEVIEIAYQPFGSNVVTCQRHGHHTPMKYGAVATHHILPDELIGLPPFICATIPAADYWIGHNIDFDWAACGRPPVKRIDTLAMSRAVFPKLDSHRLGAVMYYIFGMNDQMRERLRSAHSAAADVEFCSDLVDVIMAEQSITSLDDLYAFSEECRIPKIMTFGKFKDKPISFVDRGYVNWYRRQPDPDPYLLEAFRREGLM